MEKEYLEMILEDINGKFDLILEGHDSLRAEILQNRHESNEKHEHTAFLIKALNQKIDGVSADLQAHRADTEAHRGVYGVRED